MAAPLRPILPLAAGLLGLACSPKPAAPPTAASTPTAAVPAGNDAAQDETERSGEQTCRDWSDLDVASLQPLPQSPYTETFEHAWRTVLEKHYDPTLGCTDWVAIRAEYGAKVASAQSEGEAYAAMNGMLGELGQSHMAIVPPSAKTQGEVRSGTKMGPAIVPVDVRYLEGHVVVVDSAVHGLKSGLPSGAALVAIDEVEIAPIVKRGQETWGRELEAAFHIAREVGSLLTCPAGGKKVVQYVESAGSTKAETKTPPKPKTKTVKCREPAVDRLTMGNIKDFPAWVQSRMVAQDIGYIRFNIWLLPLAAKIEQAVDDLMDKGAKKLIFDLRGNPGGVGMMAVPLARLMVDEKTSLGVMRTRTMTQEFNVVEPDGRFDGEVVVLVDEMTGSTSEIFAQAMQDLGRVKVAGATNSAGAALPSLIEELPGGAMLQYVVADYVSPKGVGVEGRGVTPDIKVTHSIADYAAGKDPVLQAAIAELSS